MTSESWLRWRYYNTIVGRNSLTANKGLFKQVNGEVVVGEAQMALFEFRDGKICRI
jgi:hypothetical protein